MWCHGGRGVNFTIVLDVGSAYRGLVTTIRVYPSTGSAATLVGGAVDASVDGSSWTTLLVFDDTVADGWNDFDVGANATASELTPYRLFRYTPPPHTRIAIAELQYVGYTVSAYPSGACPVSVTWTHSPTSFVGDNAPVVAVAAQQFQYDFAHTPVVTGISPSQGTALGGTVVNLTGEWVVTMRMRIMYDMKRLFDCVVRVTC